MNFVRNLAVGWKVALAPLVAILLMLGLGLQGWFSSQRLTADLAAVGGSVLERVVSAQGLLVQITELQLLINQSLAFEGMGQRPETIKVIDDKLVKDMAAVKQALDGFAGDEELSADQRKSMQAVLESYGKFAKSIADVLDMKGVQLASAGGFASAMSRHYQATRQGFNEVVLDEVRNAKALVDAAEQRAANSRNLSIVLLLVAAGMAGFATVTLSRFITGTLAKAAEQAAALADGDLRSSDYSAPRDETGQVMDALETTAQGLSTIVRQVRESADQINVAASEIANGNQDLSSRTEATASALEQTAASIEELTQTTKHGADNAREANRLAQDAANVAREGGVAVGEVVHTMDEIKAQARKIAEIIGTIDGIAFQTNILALNAAVEAARAGEQGRGFAVVASEVRLLAQRSSEAAKEIRGLIQSSVERIDGGVSKVQQAGQAMNRIVEAIGRVSQMVDDVTRAAGEQANGISQVHEAVSEMDRNTQQNAAMVEEAAAAAATLRQQAEGLVASLARFRL